MGQTTQKTERMDQAQGQRRTPCYLVIAKDDKLYTMVHLVSLNRNHAQSICDQCNQHNANCPTPPVCVGGADWIKWGRKRCKWSAASPLDYPLDKDSVFFVQKSILDR